MPDKDVSFIPCEWEEISAMVEDYIKNNDITVESYWEDHVLDANHYKMICDDDIVGFFAIHNNETLMLYNVLPHFADKAQELFAKVKKYESVTSAMLPTGDEFFLSHCLDNFSRVEKQAYLSIYTDKEIPPERRKKLELRLADPEKDKDTLKLCGDFLDGEIDKLRDGVEHLKVYIVEYNDDVVGFGVIDYGRIVKDIASIGMYVCAQHRRQGFAANILSSLKNIAQNNGCRVFSGCWYYNHYSKKSMESAGAYSKTRLIRFYF